MIEGGPEIKVTSMEVVPVVVDSNVGDSCSFELEDVSVVIESAIDSVLAVSMIDGDTCLDSVLTLKEADPRPDNAEGLKEKSVAGFNIVGLVLGNIVEMESYVSWAIVDTILSVNMDLDVNTKELNDETEANIVLGCMIEEGAWPDTNNSGEVKLLVDSSIDVINPDVDVMPVIALKEETPVSDVDSVPIVNEGVIGAGLINSLKVE